MLITIGKPITWKITEITGISDAGSSHTEKIVEFNWVYDFSAFPKETKEGFKCVYSGKSLVRLYDDGWRFVEFK